MQVQVVSIEDKIIFEDMQISFCIVFQVIIECLDKEIVFQGDCIMQCLFQILSSVNGKFSVFEGVFIIISSFVNVMEEDFVKYMDVFFLFFYNVFGN